MKLADSNHGFEGLLPTKRVAFTIKNSAKIFGILSDGIYKDKPLATIRELSCNAHDAHIAAGHTNRRFRVRIPTRLDQTFSVEDEGTGIDPELIGEIYWTYGESTKTDSNDQIGALGLGSKSPFAYTKSSFIVKNRYRGIEHCYFCFLNEEGIPDGAKTSEQPTSLPSGITVEFAVRPEDIHVFHDRITRFFKYWAVEHRPEFVGQADFKLPEVNKVLEGDNWFLEGGQHGNAIAFQGPVPYAINHEAFPNKLPPELALIARNPFRIIFPMGSINFAPSREDLQYDERTCRNVVERLREVQTELKATFNKTAFAPGRTHVQFVNDFAKIFQDFSKSMQVELNDDFENVQSYFLALLLGKESDVIEYEGGRFEVKDLIANRLGVVMNKHSSFGAYKLRIKGARSRAQLEPTAQVQYKTTAPFSVLKTSPGATLLIEKSHRVTPEHPFKADWRSSVPPKRQQRKMTEYDETLLLSGLYPDLYEIKTILSFKLEHRSKFIFYVNDLGPVGVDRYRALVHHLPTTATNIFINFDHKHTSLPTVQAELDTLLTGATTVLLSSQPDMRQPVEKVKREKGTLRCHARVVQFSKTAVKLEGANGVEVPGSRVERVTKIDEIFEVDDLKGRAIVPFMLKNRSPTKVFDDTTSHYESRLLDNGNLLALARVVGLFKGIDADDKLTVLVLNAGQVAWFKKQGVNLVFLKTLINEQITELDKTDNFMDRIQRLSAMYKTKVIREAEAKLHTLKSTDRKGVLKRLVNEYRDLLKNRNPLDYAKAALLNNVSYVDGSLRAVKIASKLDAELYKAYPLLEHLQLSIVPSKHLEEYIEMIDSKNVAPALEVLVA
jgi:hypothetical protein